MDDRQQEGSSKVLTHEERLAMFTSIIPFVRGESNPDGIDVPYIIDLPAGKLYPTEIIFYHLPEKEGGDLFWFISELAIYEHLRLEWVVLVSCLRDHRWPVAVDINDREFCQSIFFVAYCKALAYFRELVKPVKSAQEYNCKTKFVKRVTISDKKKLFEKEQGLVCLFDVVLSEVREINGFFETVAKEFSIMICTVAFFVRHEGQLFSRKIEQMFFKLLEEMNVEEATIKQLMVTPFLLWVTAVVAGIYPVCLDNFWYDLAIENQIPGQLVIRLHCAASGQAGEVALLKNLEELSNFYGGLGQSYQQVTNELKERQITPGEHNLENRWKGARFHRYYRAQKGGKLSAQVTPAASLVVALYEHAQEADDSTPDPPKSLVSMSRSAPLTKVLAKMQLSRDFPRHEKTEGHGSGGVKTSVQISEVLGDEESKADEDDEDYSDDEEDADSLNPQIREKARK